MKFLRNVRNYDRLVTIIVEDETIGTEGRNMVMQNIVWEKIGSILNTLHCEDVKRESYLHLPEADEAQRLRKEAETDYIAVLDTIPSDQKKPIETYIDSLNHQAFMEEQKAYCQGYVDCIQLLAGLGILKKDPDIEALIEKIKG